MKYNLMFGGGSFMQRYLQQGRQRRWLQEMIQLSYFRRGLCLPSAGGDTIAEYSFVACLLSHVTSGHALFSCRGIIPTPNLDISIILAPITLLLHIT